MIDFFDTVRAAGVRIRSNSGPIYANNFGNQYKRQM